MNKTFILQPSAFTSRAKLAKRRLILFISLLSFSVLAAQTSENNVRLKAALAKHPDADANGDGILTMEEGKAYLAKRKAAGKSKSTKEAGSGALRAPDHSNIAYGPFKLNTMDIWIAKSDTPTPLLICIHGGGFKGGSKNKYHNNAKLIQPMLDNGISVATIDYRLTDGGANPYPIPMHDGARALQFLRYNAEKYNLDKTRIASTGGSAGGCMTLWLGMHDDLADPDNDDPILRESSRLIAMAPSSGQSCLHKPTLLKWYKVESLKEHPGGRPLFGIPLEGEIDMTAKLDALILDASPITHLSKDDPPAYMSYGDNKTITEASSPGDWVHHPIMGFKLKEAMEKLELECHVGYKGGPEIEGYDGAADFLIKKLKGK